MLDMESSLLKVDINIPFSSNRLAQIAYDVLRVDAEPKRSLVKKELSVKENLLTGKFSADSAKQLRVGINCFFENVILILETIEFAGLPTSDSYLHY